MSNKVDEKEAQWIKVLNSVGLSKMEISNRYNFKYMDVINVLRGNSYSHVTGILHHSITQEEIIVVKRLLKMEHPYVEVANFAGIEANRVRNIMGYLQYHHVL